MSEKFNWFGQNYTYRASYEINGYVKVLEKLLDKIKEELFISEAGTQCIHTFGYDDYGICVRFVYWLFDEEKYRIDDGEGIVGCLLKCSKEDKEWLEEGNKGFTRIFAHKAVLLPEIQEKASAKINGYLDEARKAFAELSEKEEREEREREERRGIWKITKVYEEVLPRGGEDGMDGYFDAEYESINGDTVRMVSRDIFDFGCFSYPKRVEGTEDVLNHESFTEAEKDFCSWSYEFGRFKGCRM